MDGKIPYIGVEKRGVKEREGWDCQLNFVFCLNAYFLFTIIFFIWEIFLFYLLMWYVKIRLDKLTILLTILNVGHSNKKFYILWIKIKIIKGVISILVKEYISNYYYIFLRDKLLLPRTLEGVIYLSVKKYTSNY